MKTIDIFPITIYEAEFPNFQNIQDDLINYIKSKLPEVNEYQGHDHPIKNGSIAMLFDKLKTEKIEDPNVQKIFDFITEHGKQYWKTLDFTQYLDPYILQLWVNSVPKGGFVASHNHNPTAISGVFYINAEPSMGNLYLENPLDLVLGKSIYFTDTENRVPKRFNYEVESVSGKLVLFPGWLKHFTKTNLTEHNRMSMAVNFGSIGKVYLNECW
jgi:uncharacterized protein (TIGR02466 family)